MENKEKTLLQKFAKIIIERQLTVPAIFFLESTKYISFIGSQALVFFGPILTVFINENKYNQFVKIIEKRENIEYLILQIENCNVGFKKNE